MIKSLQLVCILKMPRAREKEKGLEHEMVYCLAGLRANGLDLFRNSIFRRV